MSVAIERTGGKIFVNAKPDNIKEGALGGAGVHIECKDEAEAEKLAEEFKAAEAIQKATLKPEEGQKLDKVA